MHRRIRPARTAACVIVKHANPCGVAEGRDLVSAYRKAFACDTQSPYGGIIAVNRALDADTARVITEILTEVIIAARCVRGGHRDHRQAAQSAPAARRQPAPIRARRTDGQNRRRWLAGAEPRQCGGRRHRAQDGDEAGA